MANENDDQWAKFNPQPAPGAGAHPDQGAVPAASEAAPDPYEKYVTAPPPGVDYSSLKNMPPALAQRLQAGQQLGASVEGKKQSFSWHAIWDAAKEGAAAGYDAEGLAQTAREQRQSLQNYLGPNGDRLGGWSMLETGLEATEQFASILNGAFRGTQSAVAAAGEQGEATTVGKAIGTKALGRDLAAMPEAFMGTPHPTGIIKPFEHPPLIVARNGEIARVTQDADTGQLAAQKVGTMPVPADFKAAAQAIPSKNPEVVEAKALQQWHDYGVHPHELAEAAANSPVMARDLSSAQSPNMPVPLKPTRGYLDTIDHKFSQLVGEHQADISEFWNHLKKAGPVDADMDRRLYHFGEGDPLIRVDDGTGKTELAPLRLTQAEQDLYNEHLLPYRKEQMLRYENISGKDLPYEDYDPTYMHRMVVGKTPEIDRLAGEGAEGAQLPQDTSAPGGSGLLSKNAGAANPRTYFALVDQEGNRRLVKMSNEGKSLRSIGNYHTQVDPAVKQPGGIQPPLRLDTPEAKLKVGNEYTIDGKQYTLANAWTREIEDNTQNRYYKSAFVSTYNNTIRLRSAERAMYRIQQMRDTPEWAQYTGYAPGRVTPQMPQFRNDYMEPQIAHIIDDFHGQMEKNSITDTLERINNKAIGTLFWTPFPHGFNEASFAFAQRAWDNFNPKSIANVMMNGTRALHEVITQGPKYQEMLREAGSLHLAPIVNRDFYTKMLDKLGHDINQQPEGWEGYAKAFGMSPVKLYNSFMDGSNRVLWGTGDMFRMSRYLELTERKGLSPADAVAQIERFTPTYRMPHEIFGDRKIAQIYKSQSIFEFSRYHWDQLRFYANIGKDLLGPAATGEARVRAAGVLMNMMVLQLAVWPALTAMTQYVTGNDDLRVPSFGPGRLAEPLFGMLVNNTKFAWPEFVQKYYGDNNRTFLDAMRGLIPISPAMHMLVDNYYNRYEYNGRPIREQADVRAGRVGRVIGQQAEHTARTLVEPYNVFADAVKWGESAESVLLKSIFGINEQSPAKKAAKARAEHYQEREAKSRTKKPVGPLEKWISHIGE